MAQKERLVRALVTSAVLIGVGYLAMKTTTPTDKEFYDNLAPDLKKRVDEHRQAASRKAAYAEQLARAKEGGDGAGPIWDDSETVKQAGLDARDSTPPPAGGRWR